RERYPHWAARTDTTPIDERPPSWPEVRKRSVTIRSSPRGSKVVTIEWPKRQTHASRYPVGEPDEFTSSHLPRRTDSQRFPDPGRRQALGAAPDTQAQSPPTRRSARGTRRNSVARAPSSNFPYVNLGLAQH